MVTYDFNVSQLHTRSIIKHLWARVRLSRLGRCVKTVVDTLVPVNVSQRCVLGECAAWAGDLTGYLDVGAPVSESTTEFGAGVPGNDLVYYCDQLERENALLGHSVQDDIPAAMPVVLALDAGEGGSRCADGALEMGLDNRREIEIGPSSAPVSRGPGFGTPQRES